MSSTEIAPAQPAINEHVDYHSPYRTGVFDAIVRAINPDGTVAVDIYLPGAAAMDRRIYDEPAVRLRSVSYGPNGRARPRRDRGETGNR
jgi:hypothetical protein